MWFTSDAVLYEIRNGFVEPFTWPINEKFSYSIYVIKGSVPRVSLIDRHLGTP
jgi:hypothetical protein